MGALIYLTLTISICLTGANTSHKNHNEDSSSLEGVKSPAAKVSTKIQAYKVLENSWCEPQKTKEYLTFQEAADACNIDDECSMLYDIQSKNKTFVLCGATYTIKSSEVLRSSVYKKCNDETRWGPRIDIPCHFPFEYSGREYQSCIEVDSPGLPWCSTTGKFSNDTWGYCDCYVNCKMLNPTSPFTSFEHNGRCYLFSLEKKNWDDSMTTCKLLKGNFELVSIISESENRFISYALNSLKIESSWIGLNDLENEGNFSWSDGLPPTYGSHLYHYPWRSSEPNSYVGGNEDCVSVWNADFLGEMLWNDAQCTNAKNFICKENRPYDHKELIDLYECRTNGGAVPDAPCLFPFKYKGITYQECTLDEYDIAFCPTKLDSEGNFIDGEWGNCGYKCPGYSKTKYTDRTDIVNQNDSNV